MSNEKHIILYAGKYDILSVPESIWFYMSEVNITVLELLECAF